MIDGLSWTSLEAVVDTLPLLFLHKDTENRILHVNKAVADTLGVRPEDMAATPSSRWYPDEAESYHLDDLEVIRTGVPKLGIIELMRVASGERHWICTDKFPCYGDDGEVTAILVLVRDLTQEQRTAKDHRTNEQKLRSVLADSPELVVILDSEGRFTEVNGELPGLGDPEHRLVGQKLSEALSAELSAQVSALADRIFASGGQEQFESSVDVEGEPHFYHGVAVRFDRAAEASVLIAFSDRTQSRARDAEAFKTRSRLEAIVQSEPECVKVLSAAGTLLDMNPAGLRMIEASSFKEVSGVSVLDLVAPEHRESFLAFHEHVIAGGAGVLEFEIEGLKGTRRWVETHAAPLQDGVDAEPKHLAITRDVSAAKLAQEERKALEAQLRHAQKLESIGVLAGGIAHDFNNHLLAILGNADLALEMLSEDDPAHRSIAACVRSSEQAAEVCDQLLTYAGKPVVEAQPTDLNELVRDSTRLIELAISKRAELEVLLADDLPAASIDATQIQQVVINLVTNASEALVEGAGKITIRTGVVDASSTMHVMQPIPRPARYAYIEVVDTGCGMTPDHVEKIYDPFFTSKFTGRGLGLATAVGTVRSHNGLIETESTPGTGTRIRVSLPALAEPAMSVTRATGKGECSGLSGTIMVVDDDSAVLDLVRRILQGAGMGVLVAEGGKAAVELFERQHGDIDAVILDHMMPGLGGREVCTRLRGVRPDMPVLFSSGHPEEFFGTAESELESAPTAFIKKPYRRAELLVKLGEVLALAR